LVRAAVCNALDAAGDLEGAAILDLYAGSGALGLEALSRGAATAILVEANAGALKVLRGNVSSLGLTGAVVAASKVETFVAQAAVVPSEVIFLDPPYSLPDAELNAVLVQLVERGWLAEYATVVVERDSRSAEPTWPEPLVGVRSKKYGDTVLFWARN
jgi:16S rRNA (guanine966-N2)-methyltransferase